MLRLSVLLTRDRTPGDFPITTLFNGVPVAKDA